METAQRVVVCRVGNERFALPVGAVREVVAAPPRTRIPGVPAPVRGLVNVRGALITAVSGPGLLGLPGDAPANWLLLLSGWGGRVGVEVDEVEDLSEHVGSDDVQVLQLQPLLESLLGPEPSRR